MKKQVVNLMNKKGVKFSDLRTTGMILREIENELKPTQTVSSTGKLSDKVLLGDWTPWNSGTTPVKVIPKKKLLSIDFLIERTIGKRNNKSNIFYIHFI